MTRYYKCHKCPSGLNHCSEKSTNIHDVHTEHLIIHNVRQKQSSNFVVSCAITKTHSFIHYIRDRTELDI